MTEEEFAKKIKAKYPQYSSLSDKDLTKKVLKKYPTYESQVERKPGVVKKILGYGKDLAMDAGKTLLVRPGARATEAVTRLVAPNSLAAQGYRAMEDSGESQRILGMDIERQKALGQGGGKQIVGNALETAGWLYGTGKVANLAMKKAAQTSTKKFLGQMAKEGAIGSGLGSAGAQMSRGEKVDPVKVLKDTALGAVAAPVLGFGLNKLLTRKAGKVVDDVVAPKVEEPKNIVEVGDRKFQVDESTYNKYKQQEVATKSKIDQLTKQIERPDIDQQKLDYFGAQIRKEQSNLDKLKRDITGNYTATELKTLVNKSRKEFAKQGLPDTRTDEQIIDELTKKKVEYNPDLQSNPNLVNKGSNQTDIPNSSKIDPGQAENTKMNTESPNVIKRGDISQQEEVFKTKFNEKGEQYWRDVASQKIQDPDVSPQIAYKQLEMKYDVEGNKDKLFELFQEATEKTSSEQGRGLSYLNSGEGNFGPITALQHAQGVLDNKLKRLNININPDVETGMRNVLNDINNGKSTNEAIDSFIDFLTCK